MLGWLSALLFWIQARRSNGFVAIPTQTRRTHASIVSCRLNRILFFDHELEDTEICTDDNNIANVTLSSDDYRTKHVEGILKLNDGDTIRTGIVSGDRFPDGLKTDESSVHWDNKGRLTFCLRQLQPPILPKSPISLILALPRPLQLARILPMVSQMGVDQLVLTDARKVPKDYFGSHLLRTPQELTDRLVEGLTQSGDVRLPKIHIVRNFRNFLDHDLEELFPRNDYIRMVAHPSETAVSMRHVHFGDTQNCVIAVGPEGGWEEQREFQLILDKGFQAISMGSRILRTDCAVVGLLALAHDRMADA